MLAPVNRLGYGQVGYYIAKELNTRSNLHLTIIGQSEQQGGFIKQCVDRPYSKNADCLRIYHQYLLKEFIGKGRHIGWPIFELDQFTADEKHQLSSVDILFVCSQWAKDVIERNGIKTETHVVPLGVDNSIFNPSKSASAGKTVFFNCGKWEVRKGHMELAQAFAKAFKPGDAVELWLMCHNPFYTEELSASFRNKFLKTPMANHIRFIKPVENHLQVAKIMGASTVGVFPAKAEGWNLELLEMMAIGKPVIATNYAGHTEFCNNKNCRLINPSGTEFAVDNIWFRGQGNWCTFDIDELAAQMLELHELNMNNNLHENTAGIETGKKFSWSNSADKIIDVLNTE